jgi:MFS family permease
VAGIIISITYLISALFSPFLGRSIDKWGKRMYFMFSAACLIFLTHFIFIFIPDCDECWYGIPVLIPLGLGYALYAAVMWASIPLIVDSNTVGTAFGLTTAIQNMGLFTAPFIVGAILDSAGYQIVSVFFACCAMVGILTCLIVWRLDAKNGSVLQSKDARLQMNSMLGDDEVSLDSKNKDEDNYPDHVKQLLHDPEARDKVRKSMGRGSFANR